MSQRAADVRSASKFIWPLWRAARARTSVISTLGVLDGAGVVKDGVVKAEVVKVEEVEVFV